eukprot:TRINITY_DN10_c0_g1_i3.p1 TRINITY_DN10_c0_g1~~TRINITY_DN10_c0_g1_i3.p1  ORF type:complete len:316 (-),score=77.81 TRINITY_DN10_c0_g1_i3:123-953(-)
MADPKAEIEILKVKHKSEIDMQNVKSAHQKEVLEGKMGHMQENMVLQMKVMQLETKLEIAEQKVKDLSQKPTPVQAPTNPTVIYQNAPPVHVPGPFTNNSFFDSVIAAVYASILRTWIGSHKVAHLIHRGTRDGFSASQMRARINNQGETITIVRSTNGYIFGGYNPLPWNGSGSYTTCSSAWLFSLGGVYGSVQVFGNGGGTNHIYNDNGYGPTFGSNHDLYIANGCNGNNSSYTNISNSRFLFPPQVGNQPHFLNGGTNSFQVSEIEIYAVFTP